MSEKKDFRKSLKRELEENQHTKIVIDPKAENLGLVSGVSAHRGFAAEVAHTGPQDHKHMKKVVA